MVGWYVAWDVSLSCNGLCRLDFDAGRVLPSRLLSPWGCGATQPLPVVVLKVYLGAITAGEALSPLTRVRRPFLSRMWSGNSLLPLGPPMYFVRHVPVHQQVMCIDLAIAHHSFFPTRNARSRNFNEKGSDVVTDGTVGWRRRKNLCKTDDDRIARKKITSMTQLELGAQICFNVTRGYRFRMQRPRTRNGKISKHFKHWIWKNSRAKRKLSWK